MAHKILIYLLTGYAWLITAIATIISFLICHILMFMDAPQIVVNITLEYIMSTIIFTAMGMFWSVKITDLRSTDDHHDIKNEQTIFVANHSSFIDTLLFTLIPNTKKFMMSEKFAKIPLFGNLCHKGGHVCVNNNNDESKRTAIKRAAEAMKDGSSFIIYPEGKRSDNPYRLLEFRKGAFRLAQLTGKKITPVVLLNSHKGMPIGGLCYPAEMEIIIGEPFEVESGEGGIDIVNDHVRKFISKHIFMDKGIVRF